MAHLTLKQRYTIEFGLSRNLSHTEIGEEIGKCRTVVFREIKRNSDKRSKKYNAELAASKTAKRHKETALILMKGAL